MLCTLRRRSVYVLAMFLLAAAVGVGRAPSATADHTGYSVIDCGPFEGLERSWPHPNHSNEFSVSGWTRLNTVPPNGGVTDSNRVFWRGDVVRVKATGRIHAGGFLGSEGDHGPDGNGEPAPEYFPWVLGRASKYSLVGKFHDTDQPMSFLGSGPTCLKWKGDPRSLHHETWLLLAFNDGYHDDNSGDVTVTIDAFWCNYRLDC